MAKDDVKALEQLIQEEGEGLLAHELRVSLLGGANGPVASVRVGPYLLQEPILILQSLLDDVILVIEFDGVILLLLHLVPQVFEVIADLLLDQFAGEHLVLEHRQVLIN